MKVHNERIKFHHPVPDVQLRIANAGAAREQKKVSSSWEEKQKEAGREVT